MFSLTWYFLSCFAVVFIVNYGLLCFKNCKWCFWLQVRSIASNPAKEKTPDVTKEELLGSLQEIQDDDEPGLDKVVKKEPKETKNSY